MSTSALVRQPIDAVSNFRPHNAKPSSIASIGQRESARLHRPTRKQRRRQAKLQREAMENQRKLTKPLKWREPVDGRTTTSGEKK